MLKVCIFLIMHFFFNNYVTINIQLGAVSRPRSVNGYSRKVVCEEGETVKCNECKGMLDEISG